MKHSDTEFVDKKATENLESDVSEIMIHEKVDSNASNFISTAKPIDAVLRITNLCYESVNGSGNVLLSNLVAKKMLFDNEISIEEIQLSGIGYSKH